MIPTLRKAIIPAAGVGTRSLPASKAVPKAMLTLVDRPLLQYAVEEAAGAGINEIAIVVSSRGSAIERHFEAAPELEAFLEARGRTSELEAVRRLSRLARFSYILQPEPLGLGHAVGVGESFAAGQPVAVLNPDTIYDCPVPCLKQLRDVFEEKGASTVVLGRIDREGTKKYGVVRAESAGGRVFRIRDLVEKPGPERAPSDLAVLGRYVFTPSIFQAIRETSTGHAGEIQITDAIRALLQREPVYGVLFEGRRFDAGDPRGYIQATIELAFKNARIASPRDDLDGAGRA